MAGNIKAFVALIDEFNAEAAELERRYNNLMTARSGVINQGRALGLGFRAIVADLAKLSLTYAEPGRSDDDQEYAEPPVPGIDADPAPPAPTAPAGDMPPIPDYLRREG